MLNSLLFNAGSLLLAVWSAMIAVISFAAFGRDLLPRRAPLDAAHKPSAGEPIRRAQSTAR